MVLKLRENLKERLKIEFENKTEIKKRNVFLPNISKGCGFKLRVMSYEL